MQPTYSLEEAGRIPAPGDNVAIATRRLNAGVEIRLQGGILRLCNTVLEGHRFAFTRIPAGGRLLSWGLPFGRALRDIAAGDYVCNPKILQALAVRQVDFELPDLANFEDEPLTPYVLDESGFTPGVQVPLHARPRAFDGYVRGAERGVGTRNYIVILGVTSQAASYSRALEERMKGTTGDYPNMHGVVSVAHTEGGTAERPNNLELLLRTLSGFIVHPNVGAVLIVDYQGAAVTSEDIQRYMREHGYPLGQVAHRFLTLDGGFQASLEQGEQVIRHWMPSVNRAERTEHSLSGLKVALQCGGSDAFSGVSGNPLAAWVAKEVIRHGGSTNLAETDELIGAERYVLQNVRDLDTAREFLSKVERFKELAGWHGHTAEGNPSGGNNFRGLYNITIKSVGAAMKRHPDVRLDYVIDYGERMRDAGYYFMDSPGNDLESVAGQVASGANMIFFTTGNGSITNFPFVPTIKIVTTTGRYRLLSKDMDVNAGEYLDGTAMEELGRNMLDLTVHAASGRSTAGERAGHSQVSIWRNWAQSDPSRLETLQRAVEPAGEPVAIRPGAEHSDLTFNAVRTSDGYAADQVGLIMPTSLCSGQIARMIAARLNDTSAGNGTISRFVALPHTEGCGVSAGASETMYTRTLIGHLVHPMVGLGLLLEHGCEKTHNDYLRIEMHKASVDPDRFGWASVQLDGGIESVVRKVEDWFTRSVATLDEPACSDVGLEQLRLGVSSAGGISDGTAASLARLILLVTASGGTVVLPENASVLSSPAFTANLLASPSIEPTLGYGQRPTLPGLHIMETPTDHWIETATGLGATGVEVMLAHATGGPLQAHRMIPLLQVTSDAETALAHGGDLDVILEGDPSGWRDQMLERILAVASRRYTPKLYGQGNTDFQFTRGLLGVSM